MANERMDDSKSPGLGGQEPASQLTAREPGLTGEAALAHLVQALGDRDPAARRRAVSALKEIGSEEVLQRLMSTLEDGDAAARSRAANALGQIGGDETVNALIEVFDNEEDLVVANAAARWLGTIGDPRALPVLLSTFGEGAGHPRRRGVRVNAMWAIKEIAKKNPQTVSETLLSIYLFERARNQNYFAIWDMLRSLQLEPVTMRLLEVAEDENADESVRIRAIQGLGMLHDRRASPILMELLRRGDIVSYWAARALKNVRDRRAIPELIFLLYHEDWRVRMRAADILGRRKARRALPDITLLAGDSRAKVRRCAARALGRLGDLDEAPILEVLINDRARPVREMAEDALVGVCWRSRNERDAVLVILRKLAETGSPRVQSRARFLIEHVKRVKPS